MRKPITVVYAVGPACRAIPTTIHGETPEEFCDRLQRAEDEQARSQGRKPETVHVWSPLKTDVVDTRAPRGLKP